MRKMVAVLVVAAVSQLACAAGAADPSVVRGKVLETMNASSYTYLRLQTADGETWAAVNAVPAKVGDEVTIHDAIVMTDFESKALGRTFDAIVFGVVGVTTPDTAANAPANAASAPPPNMAWAGSGPGAPQPGGDPSTVHPHAGDMDAESPRGGMDTGQSPHGGMAIGQAPHGGEVLGQMHGNIGKASATEEIATVAKADGPNARTVAEVNADRLALKDKPVAIRAKVVKVNANVMGKTWVHLRDGTGSPTDDSNDLLVTSQDQPKVGDVVVAMGVVKTDVNFGSGYAYKVLIEDASFRK